MGKYILTFKKQGYIKYTSHLDMMRLFNRMFSRAGISLAYTQGFNPHGKMSLCQPLSLGYTSLCEMLEFEIRDDDVPGYEKCRELFEKISAVMPEGLTAVDVKEAENSRSLASLCYKAAYDIVIPDEDGNIRRHIEETGGKEAFLSQDRIEVMKKKKKSRDSVSVDIKKGIKKLEIECDDRKILLSTELDAGSSENLSPELLLRAFFDFLHIPLHRETLEIQRSALFV